MRKQGGPLDTISSKLSLAWSYPLFCKPALYSLQTLCNMANPFALTFIANTPHLDLSQHFNAAFHETDSLVGVINSGENITIWVLICISIFFFFFFFFWVWFWGIQELRIKVSTQYLITLTQFTWCCSSFVRTLSWCTFPLSLKQKGRKSVASQFLRTHFSNINSETADKLIEWQTSAKAVY